MKTKGFFIYVTFLLCLRGGVAIWFDMSQLVKGQEIKTLHSEDSTLNTSYTDESVAPSHIRFGFGAIDENEITQSIVKLSKILNGEEKENDKD